MFYLQFNNINQQSIEGICSFLYLILWILMNMIQASHFTQSIWANHIDEKVDTTHVNELSPNVKCYSRIPLVHHSVGLWAAKDAWGEVVQQKCNCVIDH